MVVVMRCAEGGPAMCPAREDISNFTAFSGTFLLGFAPFDVLPLSSTFPLSLLLFRFSRHTATTRTPCPGCVDVYVHAADGVMTERDHTNFNIAFLTPTLTLQANQLARNSPSVPNGQSPPAYNPVFKL